MITVREAHAILDRSIEPAAEEVVALAEALGRVVARDVVADVDWPPFDTSAMDGYALRVAEAEAAGRILSERPGLVAAGDAFPDALAPGEAVRVMTGAPLPFGADTVVAVEDARRKDGRVRFDRLPAEGTHLRRRGESVTRGTVLVAGGTRLTPRGVALAALAGADPLAARRRPRIALATTGNELVTAGESLREGQLRDSNGPMLAALCRQRGWTAERLERVADERSAVDRMFRDLREGFDALVTTGGVSAGDLDLLPAAAERTGWELLFHRVAVRPGKPIAVARRGPAFWFGLPGNPVSASVGFHVFVRRALDRLEGAERPGPPEERAVLTKDVPPAGPREWYRDARLFEAGGQNRAEPLDTTGSHDIAAHARANALIRIPAGSAALPAGAPVTCLLLDR
ncbi:MAG TPA: gephyrin-like molybdotransferase Glp [Thermoanaerobaculia bacterium]|nr:gephyrin-like molybdotransferase Glp [Thermoanaerobaculia bacterium]